MNAKRRRRHKPAVEAGGRNRPLFVKESRSCTGDAPGAADCCHRYFPLQPTVELGVSLPSSIPSSSAMQWNSPILPFHAIPECARSTSAFENTKHLMYLIMPAAMPAN